MFNFTITNLNFLVEKWFVWKQWSDPHWDQVGFSLHFPLSSADDPWSSGRRNLSGSHRTEYDDVLIREPLMCKHLAGFPPDRVGNSVSTSWSWRKLSQLQLLCFLLSNPRTRSLKQFKCLRGFFGGLFSPTIWIEAWDLSGESISVIINEHSRETTHWKSHTALEL